MTEFITVCPADSTASLEELADGIIEEAQLYLISTVTQVTSQEKSEGTEIENFYKAIFTALGKAYSKGIYDAFNDKLNVERIQ